MFMDAFEAYKKYLAIKLHFQSKSYDYFKYNGQTRADRNKFETRRDKYFFQKLAKKPDLEIYLACNLRDNTDTWVGNIFDEQYEKNFRETQKKLQSLEYMFKLDMQKFDSLNDALIVKDGNYPSILNEYNRSNIMPETLAILDGTLKVFDYWDTCIDDSIIWPRTKEKLRKYGKFVPYNKHKYNELLKNVF